MSRVHVNDLFDGHPLNCPSICRATENRRQRLLGADPGRKVPAARHKAQKSLPRRSSGASMNSASYTKGAPLSGGVVIGCGCEPGSGPGFFNLSPG